MSIEEKLNFRKLVLKIFLILTFCIFIPVSKTYANEDIKTAVYFTGIGCPHCSRVSPFLHEEINNDKDFVLIEYEIYKEKNNSKVFYNYAETYNMSLGIPQMIYNSNLKRSGDNGIREYFETDMQSTLINQVLLENNVINWNDFNIDDLGGTPKIYSKNKVLVKTDSDNIITEEHRDLLKRFIIEDIESVISDLHGNLLIDKEIEYPGGTVNYEHGLNLDGWNILWNGPAPINANVSCEDIDVTKTQDPSCKNEISLFKVFTLAITDSINPCALSVLTMMLIAIITYHPKDKKQILFSGLAFVAAVFFTYIIYGLLIVKAFQLLQSISTIKLYLYNGLGVVAIILGLLEIKDFFFYKPGSIGTEMPLSLRPKVQKIIAKITSPIGAFGLGMFVTLFLLPCTVGPYIILGGILSFKNLFSTVPYLLFYNLIFVLPMLIIVFAVFISTERVKNLEKWRVKNIRSIHLTIGLIFILLGIVILTGLF